jgi:hypothetical protein
MRPLTSVRGSVLNRECQRAAIVLLTQRPKAETIH